MRSYWDQQADTFDDEYDHGLLGPDAQKAWEDLLMSQIGKAPQRILDVGCGTGTLSVLLAGLGHSVTGIDYAPDMVAKAREKALESNVEATFHEGDATCFDQATGSVDIVVSRHLLWALRDPGKALLHWKEHLSPHGKLLLVEGWWTTNGISSGIPLHAVRAMVGQAGMCTTSKILTSPALWGKHITDERYLVLGTRR